MSYNSRREQVVNNYDFDIIENLWDVVLTINENNYLAFLIIMNDNIIG